MRNLFHKPLTWMVVVEVIVVSALALAAWNFVTAAARPALAVPVLQATGPAVEASSSGLPVIPTVRRPRQPAPLPGLNLNSGFWRARLAQLNRDQAAFEQLEWRVVRAATDAAQRYLETVVLPSIQRAEQDKDLIPMV